MESAKHNHSHHARQKQHNNQRIHNAANEQPGISVGKITHKFTVGMIYNNLAVLCRILALAP